MATLTHHSLYEDHPGARWAIPFAAAIAAMLVFIFAMLVYPYL